MYAERNSKILKIVAISVIAIAVIAIILIVVGLMDKQFGIFPEREQEEKILEYNGQEYVLKDGVETFLFIGLDKLSKDVVADSYNNNQQADFLMLMVFDKNAKTYSSIPINRDTIAEIEILGLAGTKTGVTHEQIALAHTQGKGGAISNLNTAKSVSKLLYGVKVNHYMSLTLDSVPVMNDLVGGVTLEVLDDFSAVDPTLVKGAEVTLTNEQALTYVQGRQGLDDPTNAGRMDRQRQFLKALRLEITEHIESDSGFLTNAVLKMSDYMESDCGSALLKQIGERLSTYEFVEINEIVGEYKVVDNKMEFYPDEELLKKLVIDLFYIPKK